MTAERLHTITVVQLLLHRLHILNFELTCYIVVLLIAQAAGLRSGDLCFPVPYAPEFFAQEFKSAVADMKNSVANRSNAQVNYYCYNITVFVLSPLSLLLSVR
jgi:hypothetical protein